MKSEGKWNAYVRAGQLVAHVLYVACGSLPSGSSIKRNPPTILLNIILFFIRILELL